MEKLHMQYDTIMGMLFYEFQNILETYSQILEERKEEEEKEAAEHGFDPDDYSPDRMMRNAQGYMSKAPSMSSMPSMPKIDIPKF
jgi:hypothetical protein